MSHERGVEIAIKLKKLKISEKAIIELLSKFDLDDIERQIDWLPFRKSKRPGAFLIQAVRLNYSPPKEAYYAHAQALRKRQATAVDQDSQRDHGA